MDTSTPTTPTSRRTAPVESAATVVGAVFLLVGILGFIPGITTDYGQMSFAGHDSGAMLLGGDRSSGGRLHGDQAPQHRHRIPAHRDR